MQNRLVVLSDSEPDLGDESDISIDVNATKRIPSHLSPTTEPKIDEVFNNSNDDDPGDASDNSDDGTPSATFKKRDPSHRNPTTRSGNCTPSAIQGLKTVKRKADTGGVDLHNIILPSPRAFNRSDPSGGAGERPGKYQRLTRGQGRSTVSYDMKLHPMDDVLRPKYSANRRANGKQVPEESSDSDEDENDAPKRKVTSPNAHRRRSSRNRHQSETPIYSAKWHPLDQMLRDNASSTTVPEKHDHNRNTRKKSPDYDDEDSMTINCDDERANESGGETAPISPNRRRSARVSSSKDAQPNYDMKYVHSTREQVCAKANCFLQISCYGCYPSPKGYRKANEVQTTFSHVDQKPQQLGIPGKDSHQTARKSFTKVLDKAFSTP